MPAYYPFEHIGTFVMALIHTLSTFTFFLILTAASRANQYKPIRGAYYPSWADNFGPSSINTNFFTHIFYAFLIPNNVTFKFDIDKTEAASLENFTSTLHAKNPPVKTLFSIGGGNVGPELFSRMASTLRSRAAFIYSSIEVARTYGFDGFDLDWEFPKDSTDMKNLAQLLKEWHEAVQKEAKVKNSTQSLLITAAVYYSANRFLSGNQRVYDVASITANLDWINVMNYDYHGGWDITATGAHAALYDPNSNLSTSFGIGSWIQAGVPGSKLVMGIPFYGRTWKLKDTTKFGIGAPAIGVGPGEKDGTMTFAKVVKFNKHHNVTGVFDKETVSMYSVANRSWIGYDDVTSVALKIGFARACELGGYFFWEVTGDYNWRISKTASQLW